MAYYAFLNDQNIVTEVIPGKDGPIDGIPPEEWYGNFRGQKCVRTSYNGNYHGCYAGIGFYYDETLNEFIQPEPPAPPIPPDLAIEQ